MATWTKAQGFVEHMAEKVHNLSADALTIALSNTAPASETTNPLTAASTGCVLANVTQISYTNVVTTPTADTIADGLATRTPDLANVAAIRALVDDMRLVTEEAMLAAIRTLRDKANVVAEPSGAAAVAAYMQEPPTAIDRTVVLLVSGGNVDPAVLARIGL